MDIRKVDTASAQVLLDAVRAYGVVVIKHQNLSRKEQVDLTAKLGEVVVLPQSFEGNDPEKGQPAIQRITNFWSNGTWKGPHHNFGSYWHQDGQFWTRPKHYILSLLHAQSTPPSQGETGFADLRAAYATLSQPLRERAANASIVASVQDIADFRRGSPEDLAKFPDARHTVVDKHRGDQGPLLFLGSPHMRMEGLESEAAGKSLLNMLLTHATSPSFTYFHRWESGDILLWDNVQTLHHAFPYNNDGTAKREFYRTQARIQERDT
jgi:taurine dioxygenase